MRISSRVEELKLVEKRIAEFEKKYGITSDELLKMLRGEEEWKLPEGSELDVVEWEALIALRDKALKELKA